MNDVLGVYLCSGCGIGDAIDLDKVEKVAAKECKAKFVRRDGALCRAEAVDRIKADVLREGVTRIVVAACSPRHCGATVEIDGALVEVASFREHLAWSHEPRNEDTDMLAEDMVRMAAVRVQKAEPLERFPAPEGFAFTVLVVGGGLAGLTAVDALARLGTKVVLIEKADRLGGWANGLAAEVPIAAPYEAPQASPVPALAAAVAASANVTVYTGRTIASIHGAPGLFDVTLSGGETFRVGAIVQATGAVPYDAAKLRHLGAGNPDVVTAADFEAMAKVGRFVRPSDGRPAESIVFIQCAGSRDAEHLPYCSAECCSVTLKQARVFRTANPAGKAFIIYKDMRTPGKLELFYKAAQDDPGVFLTKGTIAAVTPADGTVRVDVTDTLLGEPIRIAADLVVLATGMVPSTADTKTAPILNLDYRLGTDLPDTKYGFPDSEFVCFPYETRRTAIYAAGTVRHPMGAAEAIADARGAALKAVQALTLISQGMAVHPRALDLSYPDFGLMRCTQCKRCTEECPFGALDEDVKGTPMPNPTRCRRCGVCMGACPERIVSFKNYNVNMVSAMIKAIEIPEDGDEKPRILVLMCENDAIPALDIAGLNRRTFSSFVRSIPVRCLGSVNVIWINDSLASGFDGVLLVGCKHGDDYQCHFIKGSELAEKRMENVSEKLKQLALEKERVQIREVALTDYDRLPGILDGFVETIRDLGPNPFKGL
jgi:quinone-modifying oxidoreductase subunit QmoB